MFKILILSFLLNSYLAVPVPVIQTRPESHTLPTFKVVLDKLQRPGTVFYTAFKDFSEADKNVEVLIQSLAFKYGLIPSYSKQLMSFYPNLESILKDIIKIQNEHDDADKLVYNKDFMSIYANLIRTGEKSSGFRDGKSNELSETFSKFTLPAINSPDSIPGLEKVSDSDLNISEFSDDFLLPKFSPLSPTKRRQKSIPHLFKVSDYSDDATVEDDLEFSPKYDQSLDSLPEQKEKVIDEVAPLNQVDPHSSDISEDKTVALKTGNYDPRNYNGCSLKKVARFRAPCLPGAPFIF